MVNKPRSGLTGWQKLLLWALAVFVLWQLMMTDAIGNGLLGFFLGGEVPGTDIVLPPEVILAGTVGVAALILVVVAVRMWAGHRRVRKFSEQLPDLTMNMSAPESEPETTPKPEPVAVVAAAVKPAKQPKQKRLQPAAVVGMAKSKQLASQIWKRLKPSLQQAARGARKAGGRFAVHAIGVYELSRMALIYSAKWSWKHLVIFAKWCGAWSGRIARALRKRLGEFRRAVRPYAARLAKQTAIAWQGIVRWVKARYEGAVKGTRKAVASAKRAFRASPIPGWVASAQRKLRSGGQPEE